MIFSNRNNMMSLKSYSGTPAFMVTVSALLAGVIVAFKYREIERLVLCGVVDSSFSATPVSMIFPSLYAVFVLLGSQPFVPGNLALFGFKPTFFEFWIGLKPMVYFLPVVIWLVSIFKTHIVKTRMIPFFHPSIPRDTVFLECFGKWGVSSFVYWDVKDATSVSNKFGIVSWAICNCLIFVNMEWVKCFATPACANSLEFLSLIFGNAHNYSPLFGTLYCKTRKEATGKERELLETPESHKCYNVIGNDGRECIRNLMDWAISSQAAKELVEGSTTRPWSPERTVKAHECVPLTGRYSLICVETCSGHINNAQITQMNSVPFTEKLDNLSKHSVEDIINKVLKDDASKAFDIAAREQFDATPLRVVASAAGTDSASNLTFDTDGTPTGNNGAPLDKYHVKAIVDYMKERNIPTYSGGDYFCIGRPTTFRTIKNQMETLHQYVDQGFRMIMNGEIGRYEGVRFIEQTNIASQAWTAGKSDVAHFFGNDTVAEAIVVPEELRGKIPTNYGLSRGLAWYYCGGFGLVHSDALNARIVKWDSAA